MQKKSSLMDRDINRQLMMEQGAKPSNCPCCPLRQPSSSPASRPRGRSQAQLVPSPTTAFPIQGLASLTSTRALPPDLREQTLQEALPLCH